MRTSCARETKDKAGKSAIVCDGDVRDNLWPPVQDLFRLRQDYSRFVTICHDLSRFVTILSPFHN